MSAALVCPRCGFANPIGATFCARCAERLTPAMQARATPGTQVGPQPARSYTAQLSQASRTDVSRTETGLLLLIFGILLGPIPYVNFIGGILAIIGAILVILGRQAFGMRHSRFVILSLILYLVGLAIAIVNTFAFVFSLVSASLASGTSTSIGQYFSTAFNEFLIVAIVASAVSGIAVLLFTYALQTSTGKLLLWTGYVASLVTGILVFYLVSQALTNAIQQATSGNPANTLSLITSLQALQGQVQLLGLLALIPATINATAYYLVRSRIRSGELPEVPKSSSPQVPSPSPGTMVAK
ncbi:MAG TPA: zinc ribbon domain-containing protein [Candidatus Bathyarchaeia archaeon]|nr:zinc ribbon domain-containing protein [Candidatus Bathyarchaeia archaeon]